MLTLRPLALVTRGLRHVWQDLREHVRTVGCFLRREGAMGLRHTSHGTRMSCSRSIFPLFQSQQICPRPHAAIGAPELPGYLLPQGSLAAHGGHNFCILCGCYQGRNRLNAAHHETPPALPSAER